MKCIQTHIQVLDYCRKFFFGHYFSQKCWRAGGEVEKDFFRSFKKKGRKKKISGHKPVKLRIKNFFPDKFLLKHLIFGPISVKYRSINYIQFPLEAL